MKFFSSALAALSLAFTTPLVSAECCVPDPDTMTQLNLFPSTVVTNELHLDGGELRYNNVGVFEDDTLDLVVTITSGDYTDIAALWEARNKTVPNNTGKRGDFGTINLQTAKNKPKSGEGNFKFCLVKEGTDDLVTLESFSWTVYDADWRSNDPNNLGNVIREKMLMDISQADAFQLYPNMEESEIKVACENPEEEYPYCSGKTVFHSSTFGTGDDNPDDKDNLTDQQLKRSIAFQFSDTSCWEFTYDHYCPVDQPEYTGSINKCKNYSGGNFLFSGESESIINKSTCIPVPSSSEAPSASPSVSPPDPTPPEPECPEDIDLIKTVGVTEISLYESVHIISQDTSTVTVGLKNSWVDGDDTIDSIHYQYKIDDFTERCYNSTNVIADEVYNQITIECFHSKPFAELKICVVDDEALQDGDNAEVPKCCHADQEGKDVVCYTLTIDCVTTCVEEEQRAMRALRGGSKH